MSEFAFGVATGPDLLRLVVVPAFAWAAYRDIRTRRVPNATWLPLAGLGLLLLVWQGVAVLSRPGFIQRLFLIRVGISLLLVAPMAYAFWLFGAFGGADAKALMTLAVLVPTYPIYLLPGDPFGVASLPLVHSSLGVFSLTVLSNTVLAGLAYPLVLAARNAVGGRFSPAMFVAKPAPVRSVVAEYGRLLETREGYTRSGVDLDALRMYLRWRGLDLADLLADPDRYRDPATLPESPNPPGDGNIEERHEAAAGLESERAQVGGDGNRSKTAERDGSDGAEPRDAIVRVEGATDDPWGAAAFLDTIEGNAYGTTPEGLREGLETLVARETVWLSPGIPFIVPMFAGLVVAFTYGDALFALLRAVGLA